MVGLVRLVEEMFVVLNSAVTVALAQAGSVNCIDHHRPGDLPRFPGVLSSQETLQEENLGGEEGCGPDDEGFPRTVS